MNCDWEADLLLLTSAKLVPERDDIKRKLACPFDSREREHFLGKSLLKKFHSANDLYFVVKSLEFKQPMFLYELIHTSMDFLYHVISVIFVLLR